MGRDGLCFTLSGWYLMRFVLHLFGRFSWFLCCSWKDFESHNSVSFSSSAIPAPCHGGKCATRKERGSPGRSVRPLLSTFMEARGLLSRNRLGSPVCGFHGVVSMVIWKQGCRRHLSIPSFLVPAPFPATPLAFFLSPWSSGPAVSMLKRRT